MVLYMIIKNLNGLQDTFVNGDKKLYMSIKRAFEKLYQNDIYLIHNDANIIDNNQIVNNISEKTKIKKEIIKTEVEDEIKKQLKECHVGERAIVFRFAHYLQIEISEIHKYSMYNLDCEYNRNKTDLKRTSSFPNGAFPDLIIHKRSKNDHNLLVMEFKTYWNNSQESIDKDFNKVKEFMGDPYYYKYGLVVIIGRKLSELKFLVEDNTNNTEK